MGAIETGKVNSISRIYQFMVVSMLKNWSCRYSSHYIIKFASFMQIYYAINLDIVSSCILYLRYIDLLQVLNQKYYFPLKKDYIV